MRKILRFVISVVVVCLAFAAGRLWGFHFWLAAMIAVVALATNVLLTTWERRGRAQESE